MGCRGSRKNYRWPGICHITVNVMEGRLQPLGRIIGDASKPVVTVEDNGFPPPFTTLLSGEQISVAITSY